MQEDFAPPRWGSPNRPSHDDAGGEGKTRTEGGVEGKARVESLEDEAPGGGEDSDRNTFAMAPCFS